jgi:hypothetical protein
MLELYEYHVDGFASVNKSDTGLMEQANGSEACERRVSLTSEGPDCGGSKSLARVMVRSCRSRRLA